MTTKYRVGMIGCGGIGRKHAAAYAQMPNVELVDQAQELIDCIEEDRTHQCDGHAGRRTLEIATAVWESARSRRLIQLPVDSGESPLDALWRGESKPWKGKVR